MPSQQQNMHVFADGHKNMNDIFNNYVCSASMTPFSKCLARALNNMSARRKRVISTDEMQFSHNPSKMLIEKRRQSAKIAKPQIWLGSAHTVYQRERERLSLSAFLRTDRPVFEWNQVLLHPELTPVVNCWSFLCANGAHQRNLTAPPTQFTILKDQDFRYRVI